MCNINQILHKIKVGIKVLAALYLSMLMRVPKKLLKLWERIGSRMLRDLMVIHAHTQPAKELHAPGYGCMPLKGGAYS